MKKQLNIQQIICVCKLEEKQMGKIEQKIVPSMQLEASHQKLKELSHYSKKLHTTVAKRGNTNNHER